MRACVKRELNGRNGGQHLIAAIERMRKDHSN
jgi:hypothetical protein